MKGKPALACKPDYDGSKAQTAIGTYRVDENKDMMRGTYGAGGAGTPSTLSNCVEAKSRA